MKLDLEKAKKHLRDAVETVYSEMAFVDIEAVGKGELDRDNERFFVPRIEIIEPLKIEIVLVIPFSVGKLMTESLYPDNGQSITDGLIQDFLAESLNTIAGSFMKTYLQYNAKYTLGIPQKAISNTPDIRADITQRFDLSERIFTVSIVSYKNLKG